MTVKQSQALQVSLRVTLPLCPPSIPTHEVGVRIPLTGAAGGVTSDMEAAKVVVICRGEILHHRISGLRNRTCPGG